MVREYVDSFRIRMNYSRYQKASLVFITQLMAFVLGIFQQIECLPPVEIFCELYDEDIIEELSMNPVFFGDFFDSYLDSSQRLCYIKKIFLINGQERKRLSCRLSLSIVPFIEFTDQSDSEAFYSGTRLIGVIDGNGKRHICLEMLCKAINYMPERGIIKFFSKGEWRSYYLPRCSQESFSIQPRNRKSLIIDLSVIKDSLREEVSLARDISFNLGLFGYAELGFGDAGLSSEAGQDRSSDSL